MAKKTHLNNPQTRTAKLMLEGKTPKRVLCPPLLCCVALVPNATSLGNVQSNIEEIGTYSETRECITDGDGYKIYKI